MEKKFASAEEIKDALGYNFETWFSALQNIEPIVPKEIRLIEGDDYIHSDGRLYLSFEGAVKLKNYIHYKQLNSLEDWFKNCARGRSLTWKKK